MSYCSIDTPPYENVGIADCANSRCPPREKHINTVSAGCTPLDATHPVLKDRIGTYQKPNRELGDISVVNSCLVHRQPGQREYFAFRVLPNKFRNSIGIVVHKCRLIVVEALVGYRSSKGGGIECQMLRQACPFVARVQ